MSLYEVLSGGGATSDGGGGAGDAGELARLRAETKQQAAAIAQHEATLADVRMRAEVELQRTAAFWIAKGAAREARLAASEAAVAELTAQLDAAALRAEQQLQMTAAFWEARVRAQKERLVASGAAEPTAK